MSEIDELLHQLPGDLSDLRANSSEVISINLTRNGSRIFDDSFSPTFTYAIFGEDEVIIGYRDLKIDIDFRSHDLRPSVSIKYAQKFDPINEQMAELMDVEGKLRKFLPESAFNAGEGASNGAKNGVESWAPPGELASEYTNEGRVFQIWKSSLADPRAVEILSNMRILVPFFIEGGTIGFLEDAAWSLERWKLFLLYEVSTEGPTDKPSSYTLAGFSTSYRLWVFPSDEISSTTIPKTEFDPLQITIPTSISPLALQSRERISQFLILPPYQGQSHGSWLYNAMVSLFRSDPLCFEITVEEPNEQFDVLRDLNDMAYLTSQTPKFADLALPSAIPLDQLRRPAWVPDMNPQETLSSLKASAKLAPRQFQRLVEIHLLSTIPKGNRNVHRLTRKGQSTNEDDRRYYFWRLLVKERLFIRNKDQLVQLAEEERVPKLEDIMPGVQNEYEERIEAFERRVSELGLVKVVEAFCGGSKPKSKVPKKRKVVDEDEEDSLDGKSPVPEKKKKVSKGTRKPVVLPSSDDDPEQNTLHE